MSDDTQDRRLAALRTWLQTIRPNREWSISVASADASFRRYFRAQAQRQRFIVMDAPPDKEPVQDFVRVAGWLADWGVAAPRVHAVDAQSGFVLLDDLGDTVLLDRVGADDAVPLLEQSIDALVQLQARAAGSRQLDALPAYDVSFLADEMALCPQWFLQVHFGESLSGDQQTMIAQQFELITRAVAAQPRGFVHRDYHSRNLMVGEGRLRGMLDFQDAMHGPLSYDIVSLLRDCYVIWPEHVQRNGLERWATGLADAGVWAAVPGDLQRWFDFTGMQRHLKVLGIFCRLHHRDGKAGYLPDLPRVMNHLLTVMARYSELDALRALLTPFRSRLQAEVDS